MSFGILEMSFPIFLQMSFSQNGQKKACQAFFSPKSRQVHSNKKLQKMSFDVFEMSFGIFEMSFGVLEMSFGVLEMSFGILEISFFLTEAHIV